MNPLQQTVDVRRARASNRSGIWLIGAAGLLALLYFSNQTVRPVQFVYAAVILSITIQAYLSWAKARDIRIPAFTLLCGAHFIFYGLAIFVASRESPSAYDYRSTLADSILSNAMLVGIVGVLSMWAGRTVAIRFADRHSFRPNLLEMSNHTPLRIYLLLLMGIVANVVGVPLYGTVFWNISITLFSALPLAAFLWILVGASARKTGDVDFLMACVFFATKLFFGARFNASLGSVAVPFLLTGLAFVSTKNRLPWGTIGVVACIVIFLQPSKSIIRRQIALGELGTSMSEAMVRWVAVAASGWADVLSGQGSLNAQLATTASRSSLLTMTGLILEETPELVPYQFGASYPLLIQNLVPRVLWPEKPTVNTANQFFQVEYGLTTQENLASVSIACGFEAEGYLNFGWIGIVIVSLLVGFVFGFYEIAFFSVRSSLAATAVGLALLPGFLTIESQLVQYLGGVGQFAVAAGIVFHQVRRRPSFSRLATSGAGPFATVLGRSEESGPI